MEEEEGERERGREGEEEGEKEGERERGRDKKRRHRGRDKGRRQEMRGQKRDTLTEQDYCRYGIIPMRLLYPCQHPMASKHIPSPFTCTRSLGSYP